MKIIIDADPGTDDFIAISLALKENKFDILGITTVEGNCSLESATANTFKVLDMCGRSDIEVYQGLKQNNVLSHAIDVHGNNGLGGIYYEPINRKVSSISAIDYLIDMVNRYPNEITIICIGPLTNIAECVKRDTGFANKVKSLLIMGGSSDYGNITPYAEFNFYKDANAASDVLKANFNNILIFGWDVTSKMPLLEKEEKILKDSANELGHFIYNITRTTTNHDKIKYGGAIISDPLLIVYLLDNSIVKFRPVSVSVVTEAEQIGRSIVEVNDNSHIFMAYSADRDKFYQLLVNTINM